jgi:PHD/YefM family antitoxin component YafN of YafNO toxin-antitoxin module
VRDNKHEARRLGMFEVHKNIVLDENQKPIAVQIPIEEFERMEELIENYGLAKLMDEVADDEQLSMQEAKRFYRTLKQDVEG